MGRRFRAAISILRLCGLQLILALPVHAAERTALVVGNRRYEPAVGPLRNTVNDAQAVASVLRKMGFSVVERKDLDRDEMLEAVAQFRQALSGSKIGLFYYAGHGLSIGGSNYLIPLRSGFDPTGADSVTLKMLAETRLLNADQVVADMSSAGASCNLVILDACRTNQLPAAGKTRQAASRAGLSEMTPPAGSLIAFATDAGQTAYDGDSNNGLYTEELVKYLATPGLTIEQVFKRTRESVFERSGGGQLPAEYSRLVGDDICLAGNQPVARAIPVAAPDSAAAAPRSREDLESVVANPSGAASPDERIRALVELAAIRGKAAAAAEPMEAILETVKEELKETPSPSTKAIRLAKTCALDALPACLPPEDPHLSTLSAKALNRRGDALLLLGKAKDALECYDRAAPLDPDDSYILYNRGRANLALGRKTEARSDFVAALDPRFDQPKARALAEKALEKMKAQ